MTHQSPEFDPRYELDQREVQLQELKAENARLREQEAKAWEENRRASEMLLEERDIQIAQLKQELANAQEEVHYAIGTSELAMKHRDAAEEAFYRLARQHFVAGNRCSCGALILDAHGIGPFCERTGKDKPCDLWDLYSNVTF